MCMQDKRRDSFLAIAKAESLAAEGQKLAALDCSLKKMAKISYVDVKC